MDTTGPTGCRTWFAAARALPAQSCYLDGEAVVFRSDGSTDWYGLRSAFARTETAELRLQAFDLLELDGRALMTLPLLERKSRLQSLLRNAAPTIRYTDHVVGHGEQVFRLSRQLGLEGIVSKRIGSRYRPGDRSRDWLKAKHWVNEQLWVCGAAADLLLLGRIRNGVLEYAGSMETIAAEEFLRLTAGPCAFDGGARRSRIHWLAEPQPIEVRHSLCSRDGELRQPMAIRNSE